MNDREKFIKDFVEAGQKSGASKEEVSRKLKLALAEYDKKYTKSNGLLSNENIGATVGDILGGDVGPLSALLSGVGSLQGTAYREGKERINSPNLLTKFKGATQLTPGIGAAITATEPEARKEAATQAAISGATPLVIGTAGKLLSKTPVVGTLGRLGKSAAESAVSAMGNKAEILGNTLLSALPKSGRETAERRGINIGEEFAKDISENRITGETAQELLQGVTNRMSQVGSDIADAIAPLKEKINVGAWRKAAEEEASKATGKTRRKIATDFLDEVTSWLDDVGDKISIEKAWKEKILNDAPLYTASGTQKTLENSGKMQAFDFIADNIRKELRKVEGLASKFDEFERLYLYEKALKGGALDQLPKSFSGAGKNLINTMTLGRIRDPRFITRELRAESLPGVEQARGLISTFASKIPTNKIPNIGIRALFSGK